MGSPLGRLLVLTLSLLVLATGQASANLGDALPELNDLQRWTIFTLGDDTGPDEISGNATIGGDVGVAGRGDITLKDTATINGDLYYHTGGTAKIGPNAHVTGSTFNNQDTLLDADVAAAIATGRHAARLKQNFFAPPDIELNRGQNFTANGAPGDTVVLKLGNFALSGNSTFTLQGTASTTFIIDISRKFSLSDNAKIVLSGGVQWSNVLFNVCAKGDTVSLGDNSTFAGMLMANRRTIAVSDHASVTGELIGNRVMFSHTTFNGGVTVTHPPIVSP